MEGRLPLLCPEDELAADVTTPAADADVITDPPAFVVVMTLLSDQR